MNAGLRSVITDDEDLACTQLGRVSQSGAIFSDDHFKSVSLCQQSRSVSTFKSSPCLIFSEFTLPPFHPQHSLNFTKNYQYSGMTRTNYELKI